MIAVAALGVALSIVAAALRGDVTGEYFGVLPAVVLPTVVGRVVRRLREQTAQLAELTVHLERERERAEHAAVAEERGRIARELHDVVAHGVSVIAIQADAAEAALDRDPELARRRCARSAARPRRRWRRCAACSASCARTATAGSWRPSPASASSASSSSTPAGPAWT